MKKLNLKTISIIVFFLGSLIMMPAYNQQGGSSAKEEKTELNAEDYQEAKKELENDLKALKDKADKKLAELENRLENSSRKSSSDVEKAMEEIRSQKEQIGEKLEEVRTASKETWYDVKLEAVKVKNDAEDKLEKASSKVEEFFSSN